MARVELDVPFFDKTDVLRLGARWDTSRRVWYLPDGLSPARFSRWCYVAPEIGLRARRYFLADSQALCGHCQASTRVLAIVLPAMHKSATLDAQGRALWQRHRLPCFVQQVRDVPPSVAARLRTRNARFRLVNGACFMNHCHACGLALGDAALHGPPGGAFAPVDAVAAAAILLHEIPEPFSGNGLALYGDYFFSAMRR